MNSSLGISSLPALVKARPMIMFTGFLGSGKTTMLLEFLGHLQYRAIKSDVILNDRENAQIDRATLNDHAAAVKALTGACMCCDGYHDLVDMILDVSESKHDVLLIEFNGTSDPLPLQESLVLLESKFCLRPRWQVCVIDARHFGRRELYSILESLQLETASHYYISWASDLSLEEEQALIERIEKSLLFRKILLHRSRRWTSVIKLHTSLRAAKFLSLIL